LINGEIAPDGGVGGPLRVETAVNTSPRRVLDTVTEGFGVLAPLATAVPTDVVTLTWVNVWD
jgi:hypothetical protein